MNPCAFMVAIESVCVAFLAVFLIACIVLPKSGKLRKDSFFLCLVSLTVGISADLISWTCELGPSLKFLQYSANTLSLAASGFINAFFAYYIVGIIREKKPISKIYSRIVAIINLSGSAVIIFGAVFGLLFEEAPYPGYPGVVMYYPGGFLYSIPNLLAALSLVFLYIVVLTNSKALGRKKIIVFSVYFMIPTAATALEAYSDSFPFSYAVTAICMSIVYIMVQQNHISELLLREKLLKEWSYLDSLTGLRNRRAYDRAEEEAKNAEAVSVAFFDLNGLKKINDEEGHYEGDRLLTDFSKDLTSLFTHENVYRISGDEFVVIVTGSASGLFESGIAEMKRRAQDGTPAASFGTAEGRGADIVSLVKEAEEKMYADKAEFYKAHPERDRRRS